MTDKVSIKLAIVWELEFADKLTDRICTCDIALQIDTMLNLIANVLDICWLLIIFVFDD